MTKGAGSGVIVWLLLLNAKQAAKQKLTSL